MSAAEWVRARSLIELSNLFAENRARISNWSAASIWPFPLLQPASSSVVSRARCQIEAINKNNNTLSSVCRRMRAHSNAHTHSERESFMIQQYLALMLKCSRRFEEKASRKCYCCCCCLWCSHKPTLTTVKFMCASQSAGVERSRGKRGGVQGCVCVCASNKRTNLILPSSPHSTDLLLLQNNLPSKKTRPSRAKKVLSLSFFLDFSMRVAQTTGKKHSPFSFTWTFSSFFAALSSSSAETRKCAKKRRARRHLALPPLCVCVCVVLLFSSSLFSLNFSFFTFKSHTHTAGRNFSHVCEHAHACSSPWCSSSLMLWFCTHKLACRVSCFECANNNNYIIILWPAHIHINVHILCRWFACGTQIGVSAHCSWLLSCSSFLCRHLSESFYNSSWMCACVK